MAIVPKSWLSQTPGYGGGMDKASDIALGNKLIEYVVEGNHEKATEVCKQFVGKARYMHEETLNEFYEQFVARAGRDHPMIAQVLHSLLDEALSYVKRGHVCIPMPMYQKFVPICERHFEPNDSKTLDAMKKLYGLYGEVGDTITTIEGRVKLCEQIIVRLGRDHIVSLRYIDNLLSEAHAANKAYSRENSKMYCELALPICERYFGPEGADFKRFQDLLDEHNRREQWEKESGWSFDSFYDHRSYKSSSPGYSYFSNCQDVLYNDEEGGDDGGGDGGE